jgi:hypothetical protein
MRTRIVEVVREITPLESSPTEVAGSGPSPPTTAQERAGSRPAGNSRTRARSSRNSATSDRVPSSARKCQVLLEPVPAATAVSLVTAPIGL